jgi:thiamine-monophosphate kinase
MTETVSDLGEKELHQLLKKYLGHEEGIIRTFSEDCAVIDSGGRFYHLYSVDCLVETVHFRREYMPFFYVGRKAIKVNLSDIASMGGTPHHYLVSIGAPASTPVQVLLDIYEGMNSVTKDLGVHLIGGNLTTSAQLFIDVTVMGTVLKGKVLQRNGAKKGDAIYVTGHLGSSAEGLQLLRDGFRLMGDALILPDQQRDSHLVTDAILSHIDPPCLIDVARKLAQTSTLSSMIDLSDGIASDLAEICRESNVGARIELARLPIAPSVLYWERKRNQDPRILALCGGEDYHLLFTVSNKFREMFLRRMEPLNIELFEIGEIVAGSQGVHAVDEDGKSYPLDGGFQHFR